MKGLDRMLIATHIDTWLARKGREGFETINRELGARADSDVDVCPAPLSNPSMDKKLESDCVTLVSHGSFHQQAGGFCLPNSFKNIVAQHNIPVQLATALEKCQPFIQVREFNNLLRTNSKFYLKALKAALCCSRLLWEMIAISEKGLFLVVLSQHCIAIDRSRNIVMESDSRFPLPVSFETGFDAAQALLLCSLNLDISKITKVWKLCIQI